jgi:hypothetical protein
MVDKVTNQDVMMRLIDFYTKFVAPFKSSISPSNSLKETDIVKYHMNHLEDPSSLSQMLKVVYRLKENPVYTSHLIDELQRYHSKGLKIPSLSPH